MKVKTRGRPKHEPTEKMRTEVLALAGFGVRVDDIAIHIGITKPTLEKYYKKELATGAIKANAAVAKTLFQKAIDGDTTACIFWLKTRAGWRETQRTEITGENGKALNMKVETTLADLMIENYENRKKETK